MGLFQIAHERKGVLLASFLVRNGVVREGMEHLSNLWFQSATPGSSWKFGLIDDDGFSGLDAQDTLGSHSGWSEISETRQDWEPKSDPTFISHNYYQLETETDSEAEWEFTSAHDIRGFFITDETRLWATSEIAGDPLSVLSGDILKLTYLAQMKD